MATLREAFAKRRILLVVDNCEHLVDAVAGLASELLEAAPGVHMLATSREALVVRGEAVVAVPVLEVPKTASRLPVDELKRCEAVRLFVERAQQSRPDFALTVENATTVVERLGLSASGLVRAGCACYTTTDEVDRLVEGVRRLAR